MNHEQQNQNSGNRTLSLVWLVVKLWLIVFLANTAQQVFLYENF